MISRVFIGFAFALLSFSVLATSQETKPDQNLVTFIELGSVDCIPCRMMQPVIKKVEEKYPGQVKVVFHDVWTKKGKPFGQRYKIKGLPTQVFLDKNGKEFARHEGYFDFESLEKVLKSKGVK